MLKDMLREHGNLIQAVKNTAKGETPAIDLPVPPLEALLAIKRYPELNKTFKAQATDLIEFRRYLLESSTARQDAIAEGKDKGNGNGFNHANVSDWTSFGKSDGNQKRDMRLDEETPVEETRFKVELRAAQQQIRALKERNLELERRVKMLTEMIHETQQAQ